MTCSCLACKTEFIENNPPEEKDIYGGIDLRWAVMFLCPKCGNKRCPGAKDHRLECSGSNEPGQKGSLYE